MKNTKVIKFVAGGGKTTDAYNYILKNRNGLYLAFTNSVVDELSEKGVMAKTIDSLFSSYIIPKFLCELPIISKGTTFKKMPTAEELKPWLKGTLNIRLHKDGMFYNNGRVTVFSVKTLNDELHKSKCPNSTFLKYIFGKEETRLSDALRGDLADYLLHNYKSDVFGFLRMRFNYVIVDEAQDLKQGFHEEFARNLAESSMYSIFYGDPHQNVNGGGKWFENISPDEYKDYSFRCPEKNCEWIRNNLSINIFGENKDGEIKPFNYANVLQLNDGIRCLIYSNKRSLPEVLNNWKGPKNTVKSIKGKTIYADVVIIGKSMGTDELYTAITRTTKNAYVCSDILNGYNG